MKQRKKEEERVRCEVAGFGVGCGGVGDHTWMNETANKTTKERRGESKVGVSKLVFYAYSTSAVMSGRVRWEVVGFGVGEETLMNETVNNTIQQTKGEERVRWKVVGFGVGWGGGRNVDE